jgi:hypothetical protein
MLDALQPYEGREQPLKEQDRNFLKKIQRPKAEGNEIE